MNNGPTDFPAMARNFGAINTASVVVAAAPSRVWTVLLDRRAWFEGYLGNQHVDGPVCAAGERLIHRSDDGGGGIRTRLEEVLVFDVDSRLVLRLAKTDDSVTTAFADWRLSASAEGTALEFNVYWLDVPSPGIDWAAVQALRADYVTHTQGVIDGHLQRIRDAAEATCEQDKEY